jgi:hypothetical protein
MSLPLHSACAMCMYNMQLRLCFFIHGNWGRWIHSVLCCHELSRHWSCCELILISLFRHSSHSSPSSQILDASFDDIFPLTQRRIHPALVSFAHGMVRECYDLNIAEQMCRYSGPVLIVRRTEDEMMSMNGDVGTNRGNFLLVKILQHRYPSLATDQSLPSLWNWLQAESEQERSESKKKE